MKRSMVWMAAAALAFSTAAFAQSENADVQRDRDRVHEPGQSDAQIKKQERKAQKDADKQAKKAEREARKQEKRAAKEARRQSGDQTPGSPGIGSGERTGRQGDATANGGGAGRSDRSGGSRRGGR